MSEFNLVWRRYGLKDNPYFNSPLVIEGGAIPISSFIGRNEEKTELKGVIAGGSDIRFMITGDPGVGKTSLVNVVRAYAADKGFFTPRREIEINRVMPASEFMILTISAIYAEVKRLDIELDMNMESKLSSLYEITKYGEKSPGIVNTTMINQHKLVELFRNLVTKIVNPRFKGIIIHYDNLDNIDDAEGLADLLSEVRDFLLTKNVVFLFVGDRFLPEIVMYKPRVGQIFLSPPLDVNPLSLNDVREILDARVKQLRIAEDIIITSPHTESSIKVLFNLHEGNLREILNSLTSCILSLPPSNTPIQVTESVLRDVLSEKVKRKYLDKLTLIERNILFSMIDKGYITPTQIANMNKKSIQNISSKYLPKFKRIQAVRFRSAEGRNRYYEVVPAIMWWTLRRTDQEKLKSKMEDQEHIQKLLKDFN